VRFTLPLDLLAPTVARDPSDAGLLRAHRSLQGKLAAAVAVPAVAQRGGPSGAPGT
jgi:hypothetical protein